MSRAASIPATLTRGPFSLADAEQAGLTRWNLAGKSWRHVGVDLYLYAGLEQTPDGRLQVALRRLPPGAVFSGLTAAWLHRLEGKLPESLEVSISSAATVWNRSGMSLRRTLVPDDEIVMVRGVPATSLLRTMRDLCARSSLTEAVVFLDVALHARRVNPETLMGYVNAHARARGVAVMRRALLHAEPKAESPMESRLRMRLVLGGLPRPEAQVRVFDSMGRFAGRPDLFYAEQRLGIEYDGDIHRGSLVEDNRRQNRLTDAGVRLLRFTAGDIYSRPDEVVADVRRALNAPSCKIK